MDKKHVCRKNNYAKHDIDRRSFLKRTAIVGGGAMVSATLPAMSVTTAGKARGAEAPRTTAVNPEIPPEPIPESKISSTPGFALTYGRLVGMTVATQ